MKSKHFPLIFLAVVMAFNVTMELYSHTRIDMDREARFNRDPLRDALITLQRRVKLKYEEVAPLVDDPVKMMSDGEMYVLTEPFNYDTASVSRVEEYYKKLVGFGVKDLPPLWDEDVIISSTNESSPRASKETRRH